MDTHGQEGRGKTEEVSGHLEEAVAQGVAVPGARQQVVQPLKAAARPQA